MLFGFDIVVIVNDSIVSVGGVFDVMFIKIILGICMFG